MLEMAIILQFIDLFLEKETCIRNISKFDNTFKIKMFNTHSNSMYYFSYLFTVLWGIVFILTIIYMIIRLIWNPYEEPEQQNQDLHFNNAAHNPALISNLQILTVIIVLLIISRITKYIIGRT